MNVYKKKLLTLTALVTMMSGSLFAGCQTCAEKMAIKQSIKEALAAAVAKPSKHAQIDTLEDVQGDQPCCEACAQGHACEGEDRKKCPCCNDPKIKAERPALSTADNIAIDEISVVDELSQITCMLQQLKKMNAICCKKLNHKLTEQGHDAKKCCKKIKNELEDLEELIVSQVDQTSDCCSVTETLLLSQLDQSAICCSVTETLLLSQLDQSATCCSVTEALLLSQIDQSAVCCSIIDTNLGDPCASVVDILDMLSLPATVIDIIDTTCLDTITLLKSIYALVAQIFLCTCAL